MMTSLKPAQIVACIQNLQTVSVEVSNQLRKQAMQWMQTQQIRLEGLGDSELEDTEDIDTSMNELMQCVLYTEIRKDIRQLTDSLETVQFNLFSSRQNTSMDLSEPVEPDRQKCAEAWERTQEISKQLYEACMEVDEWRRTAVIAGFVEKHRPEDCSSVESTRSTKSVRLPIEQIIMEARERQRQRKRASSLGTQRAVSVNGDAWGASPPPISRLMQAEFEANELRPQPKSPLHSSTPDAVLSPSGDPLTQPLATLRLVNDSADTDTHHRRTYCNDVRIVGWTTTGHGLDVHTEFKVFAHLSAGGNVTVMRRYTDFVVLREVLCERYRTFRKRIPHLPHKQAFGKFDDQFLKKRESGLQFFLAYVVLHPVIGASTVVRQWFEGAP